MYLMLGFMVGDVVGAVCHCAQANQLILHNVAEAVPLDALAHGHTGLQLGRRQLPKLAPITSRPAV